MKSKGVRNVVKGVLLFLLGIMLNRTNILAAEVGVTAQNFPDDIFRNYVLQQFDKDKNGILSEAEISSVTKIVITGDRRGEQYNAKDYQGIGYFTELEELRIEAVVPRDPADEADCDCTLEMSLDVSANLKLRRLSCYAGTIQKLNLSGLPLLEDVDLNVGGCPTQDLSKHANLKKVRLDIDSSEVLLPERMPLLEEFRLSWGLWGPLREEKPPVIDFSASANLSKLELRCGDYSNRQLDLKNLKKLKTFVFYPYRSYLNGSISSVAIDLEGCSGLEKVEITDVDKINFEGCDNIRELYMDKKLPELNVTNLVNLEELECHYLYGSLLDIRNSKKLKKVHIRNSNFEEILFPDQANIQKIWLEENLQLTKLDLSRTQAKELYSERNGNLKKIFLSKGGKYGTITLRDNHLEKLDLRGIKLGLLDCDKGDLKELLFSKDGKYKKISAKQNKLTKLDLRGVKVDSICCDKNRIKKVLLSKDGKYNEISVAYNQLTKLDLRKINVKVVDCKFNKLRSLKVRGNKVLRELYCQKNQLKTLDIRKCKRLKVLHCAWNKKLKKKK